MELLWDPELGSLRPKTVEINSALQEITASLPPISVQPITEIRSKIPPLNEVESAESRTIGNSLPVRILKPYNPIGVILHMHGGGWVAGSHDAQDPILQRYVDSTGLAVVSVGYPLAPEDPYPAAPDACEAAAIWLLSNSKIEFGTERLLIMGESAGAHLATVTLLRLRDKHQAVDRFIAANLLYGVYDLSQTPSQIRARSEESLSKDTLDWFRDSFLGDHNPELRRHPDISPLYADLRQLPPALFSVGTADPLLDDSLFMYERWRTAGNDAELAIYPDAGHGLNVIPDHPMANYFNERMDRFIKEQLRD